MGNVHTCSYRRIVIGVPSLLATSGCSHVPSIDILGAYFPDWMFCIVGGILMATFLSMAIPKVHGLKELRPESLLSHLALASIFAVLGWLVIFGG